MLTQRAGDIRLDGVGFYLDGIHYPFDDVDSLRFYYVVTKKKVNFRSAGTDYNAELDIYLVGCERPIEVRTSPVKHFFDMNASEPEAALVLDLHREIARSTYRSRLARYLEMLENDGYFYYDNKQIFRNGIVSDGRRDISLLRDRPLLKSPFEIFQPAPAPKSFADRVKTFVSARQDFAISTQFDSDVFFAILEKYFNLQWES